MIDDRGLPRIIQGGMGVAISDWRLARAVCMAGGMGVVSGTGIALIMTRRLQDGDPGGHVRRALEHFPHRETAEWMIERFFIEGGIPPGQPYRHPSMWSITPPPRLEALTAASAFVEVWLAKQGHEGAVGINLLEKVQLPHLATLYGAMLAGVDAVIVGAGMPLQFPALLDALAVHSPVDYRIDVIGAEAGEEHRIGFDPASVLPGVAAAVGTLQRPRFFAIVASVLLARTMLKRASGRTDGFVVEMPSAGGHNAPPRGRLAVDEYGEPIYGPRDEVDLAEMAALERPFWLAGGYGSPEGFRAALETGAAGIQVGTLFALCAQSGMEAELREQVVDSALDGSAAVSTSIAASPTGFPFKVVDLESSLSRPDVYAARPRLCDLGYLRSAYRGQDGRIGFRCSAEPVGDFVAKGGALDETEGRVCLCNALCATAGFPTERKDGYVEAPIVTSGDALLALPRFLEGRDRRYTAADLLAWLAGDEVIRVPDGVSRASTACT